MRAYFPPCVDSHTDYLRYERGHYHATEEHGGVYLCHQHKAGTVAVTVLTVAQFQMSPLLEDAHH